MTGKREEEHAVREPLPAWESLPDFGLYMDQLLTFTERCFPGEVTAGMINSYVKARLVERPQGKKYSRTALAQLLMVCCLKQATPLESLRALRKPKMVVARGVRIANPVIKKNVEIEQSLDSLLGYKYEDLDLLLRKGQFR
jgi:hypothetical protein